MCLFVGIAAQGSEPNWQNMRAAMVKQQIVARGVEHPRVLEAMHKVERHRFVSEPYRYHAYTDRPLPIDAGQTISQPFIVAHMTELLDPEPGDRILEVGTGSGYQAAILAELVTHVYTIEVIESLASTSAKLLQELRYANITVRHGDGYAGWAEEAPFDGIIVTAAPPEVPQTLLEQLKVGARLVIPVGQSQQELQVIVRTESGWERTVVYPVRFVPMVPG